MPTNECRTATGGTAGRDCPTRIAEQLISGIASGDWAGISELYAADAVVELPYLPLRLEGRDAIRRHFARAASAPVKIQVKSFIIIRTEDPALVVLRSWYGLGARADGQPVMVENLQLIRVRDGRIVASTDFHDHQAIAAAMSG